MLFVTFLCYFYQCIISLQLKSKIRFWRIINCMLQVQFFDPCQLTESQIYEDLSQMIKAFKNLLTSMDNLANKLHKMESTSQVFEELKQALKTLQGFVKIYSYSINNQSQHKNTFHRFICRLIESMSAYKLKLQTVPYFNILAVSIKQIEQIIMSYQHDKNIGMILKKIQNVVNRFCSKTIKSLQIGTKIDETNDGFSLKDKKSEYTTITHEYQNSEDRNTKFTLVINELKPKKIMESRSENSLNKVMTLLNKKYKTLACLDIEFLQFKQLFFRSRDSKDQLYEDCFQRNSFIYKEILRYSRQFSEYLQKRQMKIFRKNKFVDSLGHNNIKVKNKVAPSKGEQTQQSNYNFTKKKPTTNNEIRKISTDYIHPNSSQNAGQLVSPFTMVRSQVIDDRFSNLVSIQPSQQRNMTPQLIDEKKRLSILPLMINGSHLLDESDRFQDVTGETFLELSKRKKNLQLKKIDISLNSFTNGSGNPIQSAKMKNKLINGDVFKKSTVQTTKQMDEKINQSIRRNYLQKKYEIAMKKNFGESLMEFQQEENNEIELVPPSKRSSSKFIEYENEGSPSQVGKQRKYMIKTSNKRPINPATHYKSLNPVNQRRQISTINNFRKLKMDKTQKIQKLQKMKETALQYIQIVSGGKAIRPALYYRQREFASNVYTEVTEEDFSDMNLGSHKEFQAGEKFP